MTEQRPLLIFDGHNDVLLKLFEAGDDGGRTFFERRDEGHIDLPRAREGGLGGGLFAVFSPSPNDHDELADYWTDTGYDIPLPAPVELGYAQQMVMAMMSLLFRLEAESDGRLKVAHSADEIEACLRDGVVAVVLHFEGAEAIDADLNALEVYYRAGLRSLGPVWSRPTAFGHGVPFRYPHGPDTGPGLTEAGKTLVRACNQLGILVDLSHLNEAGFWDVARLSEAPLVATHSNAHALCPSSRNLTDRQLDAIAESDGIVGINFAVDFLRADGKSDGDTPLATVVRHVDYLVERMGIDHVGFGSDFDGAHIPQAIGDASGLPKLMDALRKSGYDESSLEKIAHQNWLRVLRKTLKPQEA